MNKLCMDLFLLSMARYRKQFILDGHEKLSDNIRDISDPLSQPTIMVGSDHYVRLLLKNIEKQSFR